MTASSVADSKAIIRKHIRQKRLSLEQSYRESGKIAILQQFKNLEMNIDSKTIAGFFSQNGEISVTEIMSYCLAQNARIVVPVIEFADNSMQFQYWNENTPLVKNKFDIKEPVADQRQIAAPDEIDIVLYPLVAFDENCQRLGMGGGYYDKYFSFLRDKDGKRNQGPALIGCAFECQKVQAVPLEPWDIPLDSVITESKVYSINR